MRLFAPAASRGCTLRISPHPWVAAGRRAAQGLPVCRSHQSGSRELRQQCIQDRAATPTSRRADTAAWKQQEVGHCSCGCSHTAAFVLHAEACPAAACKESPADGFSQNRGFSQAFKLGLRTTAWPMAPSASSSPSATQGRCPGPRRGAHRGENSSPLLSMRSRGPRALRTDLPCSKVSPAASRAVIPRALSVPHHHMPSVWPPAPRRPAAASPGRGSRGAHPHCRQRPRWGCWS